MARKRKGQAIDGWLAIDKPLGMGSTQVVGRVRHLLNAAKVGHGGTLDPLASGILPIALGEATKTVAYVMDGAKAYRFTVRFGVETTTLDGEGEVCATAEGRPDAAAIRAALPAFLGEILQMPPIFSALKVDGARAYDLARAGAAVDLAPRRVRIDSLCLLEQADADHATFEAHVGKGTYIRALARDIARALGTVGHVTMLRRTRCGPFDEARAISLETLAALGQGPAPWSFLLPVATALDDIPALALTEEEARRLRSGCPVPAKDPGQRGLASFPAPEQVCRAMTGDVLVALARIQTGQIRSVRVLVNNPNEGDPDVDHP